MKPSFSSVFNTAVKDKNKYEEFMKKFVKRLNREKLLSAGLMNIPTWKEMIKILERV